jgi:L-malate glycosyltransferase
MKIGFVLPSLAERGPIIFTRNLVEGLLATGTVEVEVFFIRGAKSSEFPAPCTKLTPWSVGRLLRCDVIHSTSFLPDLLVSLLPARRAKKLSSLHNIIEEDLAFTYSRLRARLQTRAWVWALGRFGRRIFSSRFMAEYYQRRLAPASDSIIEYGVPVPDHGGIDEADVETFEALRRRSLKIIGAVCLVIRRKGLDQLVRALRDLPDCALVVVGDGPEADALTALAASLGVADRFRILGFRKHSIRYNARFDLFAMVSRSEGFCMAMLEAMACRIPVVCSRLPLYADLIPEERVAFFDLDDIEGLVGSLSRVLQDRERYAAFAQGVFQARFTIEGMSAKHVELYREICERQ